MNTPETNDNIAESLISKNPEINADELATHLGVPEVKATEILESKKGLVDDALLASEMFDAGQTEE